MTLEPTRPKAEACEPINKFKVCKHYQTNIRITDVLSPLMHVARVLFNWPTLCPISRRAATVNAYGKQGIHYRQYLI